MCSIVQLALDFHDHWHLLRFNKITQKQQQQFESGLWALVKQGDVAGRGAVHGAENLSSPSHTGKVVA